MEQNLPSVVAEQRNGVPNSLAPFLTRQLHWDWDYAAPCIPCVRFTSSTFRMVDVCQILTSFYVVL